MGYGISGGAGFYGIDDIDFPDAPDSSYTPPVMIPSNWPVPDPNLEDLSALQALAHGGGIILFAGGGAPIATVPAAPITPVPTAPTLPTILPPAILAEILLLISEISA